VPRRNEADESDGREDAAGASPNDPLPIRVDLDRSRLVHKRRRACLEVGKQTEKLTAGLGRHCCGTSLSMFITIEFAV
jgi:hypothetical protein